MTVRLFILVLLLGLSYIAAQHLYYEPLIVPKLQERNEIPGIYWTGVFALEVMICIAVIAIAKSAREWILFCLIGGFVIATIQWTEGFLRQPGHLKIIEGGVEHFALQYGILVTLLFAFVGGGRLLRRLYSRFKAPPNE